MMSRPTTKQDLILAANTNYEKLLNLIGTLTETELNTPFHFENDEKKKEAHWKRDQNLEHLWCDECRFLEKTSGNDAGTGEETAGSVAQGRRGAGGNVHQRTAVCQRYLYLGRRQHAWILFCQLYVQPLRLGDQEADSPYQKL